MKGMFFLYKNKLSTYNCTNSIRIPPLNYTDHNIYVTTEQVQDFHVILSNLAESIISSANPAHIALHLSAFQVNLNQRKSTCFSCTFVLKSIQKLLLVIQNDGSNLNVILLLMQLSNSLEHLIRDFVLIGPDINLDYYDLISSLSVLNSAVTQAIDTELKKGNTPPFKEIVEQFLGKEIEIVVTVGKLTGVIFEVGDDFLTLQEAIGTQLLLPFTSIISIREV